MTETKSKKTQSTKYVRSYLGESIEFDVENKLHCVIMDALLNIESNETRLRDKLQSAEWVLERVKRNLDAHMTLNALGEFQSTTIECDRLIAERDLLHRNVRVLFHLAGIELKS